MPRPGQFDTTYPDKLKEIGIELLEEFKGSKKHHHMRCMACDHEWIATPISKLHRSYKIFGVSGCPRCKQTRLYFEKQQHCIQLIKDRGFEILSHMMVNKQPHVKFVSSASNASMNLTLHQVILFTEM